MKNTNIEKFLPTTKKELESLGWNQLDVILFSGDAYVDHPSFGIAIIGRVLQKMGLKVAIVPQPNWRDDLRDFKKLGKPRLFFGVSSGAMDSMVNHYTANKRLRSDDAYTPAGKAGFRPDYATTVYTKILKSIFPEIPVILGGIEASLRRLTHYDYWADKLFPSILIDSGADLLVYGMGEKPIKEIVQLLNNGVSIQNIRNVHQTAYATIQDTELLTDDIWKTQILPSHEACTKDKTVFQETFNLIETESNNYHAKRLVQKYTNKAVIVNPPFPPLSEQEMDEIFDLPFTRLPHPKYQNKEQIPAYEMIKFSVNIHRGCFGGCSFCTLAAHQGKFIQSRSEESIIREIDLLCKHPEFKGYITDLGGPSANMYKMQGINVEQCKKCKKNSCIFPDICNNLDIRHDSIIQLYRKTRKIPAIKKVTIGSGVRYDLFVNDKNHSSFETYIKELMKFHISGRLKVAPEHASAMVLNLMRKPDFDLFKRFKTIFDKINKSEKLNLQLIPYFISSHPGCKPEDMALLAIETKNLNFRLDQVQDFTPTPMTLASVLYYTGFNNQKTKIYVAKNQDDKQLQKLFFFWYERKYHDTLKKQLLKINRKDLIIKLLGKH